MPIEISFGDFDTVCYSNQHNIIELINHAVNIGVQININAASIDSLKESVDKVVDDASQTDANLNSLVTQLNALDRQVQQLRREYDTFSYAVTADLDALKRRVDALEG